MEERRFLACQVALKAHISTMPTRLCKNPWRDALCIACGAQMRLTRGKSLGPQARGVDRDWTGIGV